MSQNMESESTATPKEVLRYFSPKGFRLVSVRSDGSTMLLEVGGEWKPAKGIKAHPDKSVEQYIAHMREQASLLPRWAQEVRELPSMADLKEAFYDGICPTTTGDDVEPDGYGPDGAPSWLRALGLI